jgi:hypothetical protein
MEGLNMRHNLFGKFALSSVALAGVMMFSGTPRALADDCQKNIAKADHDYHEAMQKHGYNSKEADHERAELREAREKCWNANKKWWDEDSRSWRTSRDWDDNDHRDRFDRDRDHDRDRDRDADRDRDRDYDRDRR